nr:integrase, catalytic region, zinc finger, CCHC-type, peptidase aspartic, catalytic [Tanacetum cinerariifolium]
MCGSRYGEQDRKATILYEYETFKANEGEHLLDTYLHYLQVINDLNKCGYKKVNCDVNDALGYKKKAVVITSDPLALLAEKRNAFNRKFYSKPTNNNLRTSSTSQSANKKQEFVKSDDKKEDKKADEKKRDISKIKCYNCKKEGHFSKDCKKAKVKDYNYYKTKMLLAKKDSDEQVLLAEDQAWMESSSDSDQEINANMVFMAQIETKRIEKANQQSKEFENQNKDLQDKYDVLENQTTTFEMNNNDLNERLKVLIEKNDDLLAQPKVLQDQLQVKHVMIDTHVECFENPKYFENAKDLRPSLYDEKVIGLGYTPMFLTHSNEDLEIEKFRRTRENKIEFAYDYGNLNASYQTSSLKSCVPNVILEKIIIDLEDEVMSLLEKDKVNIKTIESLKSKGFESSENVISESENQSENDCLEVEKECNKVENSKVITPGMFKLSKSQSVSPISMSITSYESKKFKNLDTFSSVRRPKHSGVIWKKKRSSNTSNDDLSSIYLWIIDSGCSKHMTDNRAMLTNFVEKFLGTVRFGNNDFAVIAGYGDVVIGSMTIKKVYYVEGLRHNLFSVGQFCDKCLEVAFQKSTCFVQNEDGFDLHTGDRSSNLYTIALNKVASNSSTCLLANASSSQSWLWHQRLSHLNFATINNLVKNNLVQDEDSEVIISFIKKTQVNLQLQVQRVRTDNGTEFKNKTLAKFFDEVGITQHFFAARTPQQNGVVERRNRTLVDVGKLKAKGDTGVLVGYLKESAAFRIYNKRTRKIHESVNVNFDEISEMASKQFSLEPVLSNLNETGKSSNPLASKVSKASKKDLKDLFHNFYDEYFDSSNIMKSSTTNVETSINEEVFHEISESFQGKSSSFSLNDDVQHSPKESISNNMILNVDEASTSHNVFNERLKDA